MSMGSWCDPKLKNEHLMINWTRHPTPFFVPKIRNSEWWAVGMNLLSILLWAYISTDLQVLASHRRAQRWTNLQFWATTHSLDAWKWGCLHTPFSEQPQNLWFCSICWWYSWSQHLQLFCDLRPVSTLVSQICEVHRADSDERQEGGKPIWWKTTHSGKPCLVTFRQILSAAWITDHGRHMPF